MGAVSIEIPSDAPQDPFYSATTPSGPAFLDTAACLCTLREASTTGTDEPAWRCAGSQFQMNTSNTTSGKWFRSIHNPAASEAQHNGSLLWDASTPPDTSEALTLDEVSDSLVALGLTPLSVYDAACTGKNQTTFSTAYYRATAERESNKSMIDALPCWLGPTAVPVQIMGLEEWQRDGCNAGFLCENNTVNSLPQFCPPLEACAVGRAAGLVCQLDGTNVGMGPFEPVLCQGRYYCPEGGAQKIRCPAGHFCRPGSVRPTPCSLGSSCPEGSVSESFYAPLVVLVVLDFILVLVMVLSTMRKRKTSPRPDRKIAGYRGLKSLSSDEESCSTLAMDASPRSEDFPAVPSPIDATTRATFGERIFHGKNDVEVTPQLDILVASMRKATETAGFGLTFSYTNLSYQPRNTTRPILHNVTGSIRHGSLTAIMGGSGAGKSTFINVLMGKLTSTGGSVAVNNVSQQLRRYKKLIGYVPQDDIVLPELTVRENILHSARIRLPRDWTDVETQAHVDAVIDCLELSHVRDSLIGTTGRPLISGGQRRRVSIGMELAAAPMAMFLDEPTSGLDAASASSIMRTLRSIVRLGITVIVTIHQPRADIMAMVDELMLLADGQVVCQGSGGACQEHLERLGFSFPACANPGDVITDIITGNSQVYKAEGHTSTKWLVEQWAYSRANHSSSGSLPSANASVSTRTHHLWPSNKLSAMHMALHTQTTSSRQRSLQDATVLNAIKKRGASHLRQTQLCLQRAMLQQWRHKASFGSEMALASLAAFLLGLSQSSKNGVLFHGIYNASFAVLSPAADMTSAPQLSLLVGVSIGLISAGPGVRSLSEETLLQRREADAGHSRAAYLSAKVLASLPRMLAACAHFSAVMLFLARLSVPWGVAAGAHLAYFWCVHGLAAVVAVFVRREDAPLVATMSSLVVGVMCGAAPSLAQVGSWGLAWLWRMSPGVWLTEVYFGEIVRPAGYLYRVDLAAAAMGMRLDATARDLGVLVAIGVVYRVVAFGGLVWGTRLRI